MLEALEILVVFLNSVMRKAKFGDCLYTAFSSDFKFIASCIVKELCHDWAQPTPPCSFAVPKLPDGASAALSPQGQREQTTPTQIQPVLTFTVVARVILWAQKPVIANFVLSAH